MPLTPLHVAPAMALFAMRPRRWNLAGLMMGSIIPDVEVPILFLSGLEMQTGHGALHSILGALTVDIFLAVLAIYMVFPTLARLWEGKFGTRWIHFAGVDVANIEEPIIVGYSAVAGISIHLTLDYLTHTTMPYFWPFNPPIETLGIGRAWWWMAIVNTALLVILLWLSSRYLGKIRQTGSNEGS